MVISNPADGFWREKEREILTSSWDQLETMNYLLGLTREVLYGTYISSFDFPNPYETEQKVVDQSTNMNYSFTFRRCCFLFFRPNTFYSRE